MKFNHIVGLFFLCAANVVTGQIIELDEIPRTPFDQDLYESVLDPELCEGQMSRLVWVDQLLLLQFLDAGFRIPAGLFEGNANHLGNYFQCLNINDEIGNGPIQGKYSFIAVPLNQTFVLPFIGEINGRTLFDDELRRKGRDPEQTLRILDELDIIELAEDFQLKFGLCIPQACTAEEWITHVFFNVTLMGFQFEEEFVRLPNDKPWVVADWVAIAVFGTIAILTILSTCYDLHCTFTLQRDRKQISQIYSCFSVYTNARRLTTFTKSSNALECLDGIRSVSMIWIIIAHTFTMHDYYMNLLDALDFLVSGQTVYIATGVFAVDTFLMMTGLLLVYTAVGRMKSMQLLKGLHMYYIHRILRLFPLLGAIVLLEASVFHRIADGPFWMNVARNTENCRKYWWSTLLYVQNYVNPERSCIEHSWYLAIDMQLHIISPIVLFWVLSEKKKTACIALVGGLLAVLTASTIFNFMMDMPSIAASINRVDEMAYYMNNYYKNTLTRASPFFLGMIVGYILNITKGQKVKIHWLVTTLLWLICFAMFAIVFYGSYVILQLDWDNQVVDNIFNSFSRPFWSLALSWLIFACVHGYGGPINWFLSLSMWKLVSRISYAMYLFHYSFIFIAAGMRVAPIYFTPAKSIFDSFGHFSLSFIACFALTVVIDAPFSTLTKIVMGGGVKKKHPPPENKPDPEGQTENQKEIKTEDKANL